MIEGLYQFLLGVGESLRGEDVKAIAVKMTDAWIRDLVSGYAKEPLKILGSAWEEDRSDMVLMRDIQMVSLCRHHLLPFFGKAHVAYIPDKRVVGLSKIAELVECLSRRLQTQEGLSHQITEAMMDGLHPLGAACLLDTEQLCVSAIGVRQLGSRITTISFQGLFREDPTYQGRFLNLIG